MGLLRSKLTYGKVAALSQEADILALPLNFQAQMARLALCGWEFECNGTVWHAWSPEMSPPSFRRGYTNECLRVMLFDIELHEPTPEQSEAYRA